MKWFRLYHSLANSVRVGRLTDRAFRLYILLQCAASEKRNGGRTGLTLADAAWQFRFDADEPLLELTGKDPPLAVLDGEEIVIPDWMDRQTNTDDSSGRTREYRKRLTLNHSVTSGDGDVTGNDRHSDAPEEIRGEEKRGEETITPPPVVTARRSAPTKKGTRLSESWVLSKSWAAIAREHHRTWSDDDIRRQAILFKNHWLSKPGKAGLKLDWKRTWENWCLNAIAGGAPGAKAQTSAGKANVARAMFEGEGNDERPDETAERDITGEARRVG